MILPGETEAGTAGTQPCRGISRWAHRDDERGRESSFLRRPTSIGSKDPHALKIPARRAEYSLTENVASPFQPEPRQNNSRALSASASSACAMRSGSLVLSPSKSAALYKSLHALLFRDTGLLIFIIPPVSLPKQGSKASRNSPSIIRYNGAGDP